MAKMIEELVVGVTANAGGMKSGLAQASSSVLSFGGVLKRLAAPIAGAFAVGRVVSFSSSIIASADAISEQARSINASVEGMIGLQHAASISNMEIADLTQNTMMLQKRLGTGDANSAIKRIGLDAMALKTMKPDAAIVEIMDALSKVENPAQRAALSMEMFGRGGLKMLTLAQEGKDGLKAMAKEAEELGLTMNAMEAKRFEDINDNFTRMKSAIKGVAQTFLIELAPAILSVTESMVSFGKTVNQVLERGSKQNITALGAVFKWWRNNLSSGIAETAQATGFEQFAGNLRDVNVGTEEDDARKRAAATQGKTFADLGTDIMAKYQEQSALRAGELTEKFKVEDFAAQREELNKLLADGFIDQSVFDAAMKDLEERDPVAKWFQKLLDAGQEAIDKQKGLAESMAESVLTPWEKAQETITTATELMQRGLLSVDEYNKIVQASSKESPQQKSMEEAQKKAESIQESVMTPQERATKNIQEAESLYMQGALDPETLRRVYDKESKAFEGEKKSKGLDAISGGDIAGQIKKGQIGGAMDVQQEQLTTQKRMEYYLSVMAKGSAGGFVPAYGR